jgi:hypothetical protein
MKLVPWLLALHLLAITVASYVALTVDCDGPRLRALWLSFMITGWITALASASLLVYSLITGGIRTRDVVLLLLLLLIGLDESRMATHGWEVMSAMRS